MHDFITSLMKFERVCIEYPAVTGWRFLPVAEETAFDDFYHESSCFLLAHVRVEPLPAKNNTEVEHLSTPHNRHMRA